MKSYRQVLTINAPKRRAFFNITREVEQALYKSGIVNGKDNAIFAPRDLATRAEAAVIISRAMNLIK